MASGTIKDGYYGKYYQYTKDGVATNLSLKKQGLFMTVEQLDELVEKGKVTFEANGKIVLAKLTEYYNSYQHKKMNKITYKETGDDATPPDPKDKEFLTSKENIAKIEQIFSDNNDYWSKVRTNEYLKTLKLSKVYQVETSATEVWGNGSYITQAVFFYNGSKSNTVCTLYLKSNVVYFGKHVYISAAQYEKELEDFKEYQRVQKEQQEKREADYRDCMTKATDWLYDIAEKIWSDSDSLNKSEMVKALGPIVEEVNPTDTLDTTLTGMRLHAFKEIFKNIDAHVLNNINQFSNNFDEELIKFKNNVLRILRFNYDYYRIYNIRNGILTDVNQNGIEAVTDGIPVEQALDLGRFRTIKQVLVKGVHSAPEFICLKMYLDIMDEDKLKESILFMLKTYHAFFDFPDKDIKAIAKFVANNNLDEYYDKVAEHDEAIEVLLKEGNPSLRKKIMSGIAGTPRMESLNLDKTFFTERTLRVRDGIIVNDPLGLLDDLRKLIPAYNVGSDVAILTNIILSGDGTEFTYQFYTFSENSDGGDFDGRRVQYMTRLYNQGKPDGKKIYFDYT